MPRVPTKPTRDLLAPKPLKITPDASPKAKVPRITGTHRGVHFDFKNLQLDDAALFEALQACRSETVEKRQIDHFEKVYFANFDFDHNCMSGLGVKHLIRFMEALELRPRMIRLDHNFIGDDGLAHMVEFIQHSGLPLEQLHMSHNRLTENSVGPLLKALSTHGGYPRLSPDGEYLPLWLRLEHNHILDPERVVMQAKLVGCTFCCISPHQLGDCSTSHCANSTFQASGTAKVHLVYLECQDEPTRKSIRNSPVTAKSSPKGLMPGDNPFSLETTEEAKLERQYTHREKTYADNLYVKVVQPSRSNRKKDFFAAKFYDDDYEFDEAEIYLAKCCSLQQQHIDQEVQLQRERVDSRDKAKDVEREQQRLQKKDLNAAGNSKQAKTLLASQPQGMVSDGVPAGWAMCPQHVQNSSAPPEKVPQQREGPTDEAIALKIFTLMQSNPDKGYRLLHKCLKEDPEFQDVGVKKVQVMVQFIRDSSDPYT